MRQELQFLLQVARELSTEDLPRFLGDIEEIRCIALMRLSMPRLLPTQERDQLLTVEQAATQLNVSLDYLYRHARELPFIRRIGKKVLCSSSGIALYLRQNDGLTARRQEFTIRSRS